MEITSKPNIVDIRLVTTIDQGGEVNTTTYNYKGKAFYVGEVFYLNYDEPTQPITNVMISVKDKVMRIKRKGASEMSLTYAVGDGVAGGNIRVPQGTMQIGVDTKNMSFDIEKTGKTGIISFEYELVNGDVNMGHFVASLHFG